MMIDVKIIDLELLCTHRFQELAKAELGHEKSFAYPKFFALRKYVELIRRLVASASTGESTHKELKSAHKHTNKN